MIHYNLIGTLPEFDFSIRKTISSILRTVAKLENIKSEHVISFILVDKNEIHEINKSYRNIDRPTDVISFATIDDNPNRELSYELGDIYLCIPKVIEQAEEYNHSIKREFAFLVTHGTLHLLGYDHMEEEEEKEMFKLQEELLDGFDIKR